MPTLLLTAAAALKRVARVPETRWSYQTRKMAFGDRDKRRADASGHYRHPATSHAGNVVVDGGRCWSAGIRSRVTGGSPPSMTRDGSKIRDPPAGIFPRLGRGSGRWWTRYISLTPRASCWNVAIFFESVTTTDRRAL
jgi:hypothetical protein